MTGQPALEVLRYAPRGKPKHAPLVFVHGAHVAAWCWDEHFLGYFVERGYPVHAVSLRGHGASEGRESLRWTGLADYVADVLAVTAKLGVPPVLIGHSMGATIVQRVLRRSRARAGILMAPVPLTGLGSAAMLFAARDSELFRELALIQLPRPPYPRLRHLSRAAFSDKLKDGAALAYLRRMQPESDRALLELCWPQYPFMESADIPVLVLAAGDDALFPPWTIAMNGYFTAAQLEVLPGMAHAMMLEPEWRRAADRIVHWMEEKGY